ncbi:MAG: Crp/Fnr family transcriptional regulator [Proteobacteria bacterium]|nr:Crp/Fnr family transcriptional regulator [Pseudomonadota bacterium]
MDKTLRIISESQLFNGLPEEHLVEIRKIAIEKEVGKGENIFFEGDDGNGFYLVIHGKVKIYKLSVEGKEKILHIFDGGEPFGEVPVFSGRKFPANAEALAKSRLLFFPRKAFVDLVSNNPSLSLNMLAVLSKRLNQFAVQIENLSLKEVPARLASYLALLSEEQENRDRVVLNISKGQLASLLGTIPETLSRILSRMSLDGLITVKGREITILDRFGLEETAETGKLGEE